MNAPANAQPTGPLLRDIHLPPAPSWWPPAPGWWLLALLIVLAFVAGLWQWRRHRHRRAEERRVLAEVDNALALWREQPQALAAELHQLLRRAAARLDTRAVRQGGEDWRNTLARMPVDAATLQQLLNVEAAMYRPHAMLDAEVAANATRRWLQLAWRAGFSSSARASAARPIMDEVRP